MTAKEIQALRKRLKLDQQGFADKLGVHRITVTRWEAGKKPSPLALRQLKRLLRRRDE